MTKSFSESTNSQLSNEELLLQYKDLIYKLAHAFHRNKNLIDFDDLVQTARLSALSAYRKYNSKRGNISTLLYVAVYRDLLKFVRRQYKYLNKENVELIDCEYKKHDSLDDYLPSLSGKESKVLEYLKSGYKKKFIMESMKLTEWDYRITVAKIKRKFVEKNA